MYFVIQITILIIFKEYLIVILKHENNFKYYVITCTNKIIKKT
jgi:hypothetical protein